MVKHYESVHQSDLLLDTKEKSGDEKEYEEFIVDSASPQWWVARSSWKLHAVVVSILLVSVFHNGLLYHRNQALEERVTLGVSRYTGLPTDMPVVYLHASDYSSNNKTLANELWDSINLDALEVVLSPEYVAEHSLDESTPFPWDPERHIYFLKVFHSLHCLRYIRKAFMDFEEGNEPTITSDHVYHCLDTLRQDVTCKADDTPMPSVPNTMGVGDQQILQCRNISKVVEWALATERNACFRDDGRTRHIVNKIDRYAYCPEDSPYYAVMTEYFDKHGHRNPYGDDSEDF